jgi:ribosomal protein L32E
MVDEKTLEEMRANFEVDRGREDPKAERRHIQKEVRHDLIRRAYDAYMRWAPEWRRTTTEAVRQIKEGWEAERPDGGFGVRLTTRTIYRALGLRPPDKK